MANPSHVARLRDEPHTWNTWRDDNPDIIPDLSDLDLREVGTPLQFHCNLANANLTRSNLAQMCLYSTTLDGANLSEASLERTQLFECSARNVIALGLKAQGLSATRTDFSNTKFCLPAERRSPSPGECRFVSIGLVPARVHSPSGATMVPTCLDESSLLECTLDNAVLDLASLRNGKWFRVTARTASCVGADCVGSEFTDCTLDDSDMFAADLHSCDLAGCSLVRVDLSAAILAKAFLGARTCVQIRKMQFRAGESALIEHAQIIREVTRLNEAKLRGALLWDACLNHADMVGADLSGAWVFGASCWATKLDNAIQHDLRISLENEARITVDDLEIAHFIYSVAENSRLRRIVDKITAKLVLVLGRFSDSGKLVLDGMRDYIRSKNLVPVVFDFECPVTRSISETVTLLARLAHLVIADISDPRSVPDELRSFVPDLPSVPVIPIIQSEEEPYGMFEDIQVRPWVRPLIRYRDITHLLSELESHFNLDAN